MWGRYGGQLDKTSVMIADPWLGTIQVWPFLSRVGVCLSSIGRFRSSDNDPIFAKARPGFVCLTRSLWENIRSTYTACWVQSSTHAVTGRLWTLVSCSYSPMCARVQIHQYIDLGIERGQPRTWGAAAIGVLRQVKILSTVIAGTRSKPNSIWDVCYPLIHGRNEPSTWPFCPVLDDFSRLDFFQVSLFSCRKREGSRWRARARI